jgi:hypothetical protein
MSFDSSDNLFFADDGASVVREVYLADASNPNYGLIQTITGGGNGIRLELPFGVYADPSGELFFSNSIPGQMLSVTATSTTPGAFTVTVATTQFTTTSSSQMRVQAATVNRRGWPLGVGLAIIPFGLLGVMRKRRKLGGFLLLGLLASLLAANGCGSSSQKTTTITTSGTPTGSYTLTVTATSGSASQQTSLALVVD